MSQVVINHPPDRNQSAAALWCFVAIDKEGNESPCGMLGENGWTLMAASKWEVVEQLRPLAQQMARVQPALKIVLRQYHEFTDLETL